MQSCQWLDEGKTPSFWCILRPQRKGTSCECASCVWAHTMCQCLSTLSNVLDSRIHSQLMQGADELRESPALQALKGQEVDLVLDAHSCAAMTTYYCVCHVARCIFWLEDLGHKELDIRCPSDMCSKSQSPRVHCASWPSSLSSSVADNFPGVKAQYW